MADDEMLEMFTNEFDNISDEVESIATEFYDDPGQEELEESYRLMHTLKGNCYTAGFEGMGTLVHTFEDVLGDLKENDASPDPELGDLLLDVNDALSEMLENDPSADAPTDLMARIKEVAGGQKTDRSDDSDGSDQNDDTARSSRSASTQVEIQEIPVSIDQLDQLFRESENLRAELLERDEHALTQQAGRLSRTLLEIRLIRPKTIVPKLKRLVRNTAKDFENKSIDFSVSGEDTQASASVIEDLSKILPHLLKNCIDHGIENADKREANGKDPEGSVELKFEQISSSFVVSVSDDGAGLEAETIAELALDKGIVSESELSQMTRYEKLKLIFESGFSTTEDVSEVSGRGVGMDAVATTVREYGGRIEIDTEKNKGTTFELHFPVPFQWDEFLLAKIGNRKIGLPVRYIDQVHCLDADLQPTSGMVESERSLPLIGFEQLDPRFGDEIQRPLVVLDLMMPVALAVDDLIGFTGTLILSPPSESRESFISGIGRDPEGENFWGINLREVSRNINSFMVGA